MAITRTLAEWIAESKPLLNDTSLILARNAMIDIVGCMIVGSVDESTQRALIAVSDLGAGPASVVGAVESLTAPYAALVTALPPMPSTSMTITMAIAAMRLRCWHRPCWPSAKSVG